MNNTSSAHTFTPQDNSLKSKASALKDTLKDFQRVKTSEQQMSDKKWARTAGTKEEIAEAKNIILNSLKKAQESLSDTELKTAVDQKILTNAEISEFISVVRFESLQKQREKEKASSDQKSQKRNP